jgi:hypothetical protein
MQVATQPTSTQTRQIRHALTALTHITPGRRLVIESAARNYLDQIDRRRLPVGYSVPIHDDRRNRIDAFTMGGGHTLARMLGIAATPSTPDLPATARAILYAIDTPVRLLTEAATRTGQPLLIAVLWMSMAGYSWTARANRAARIAKRNHPQHVPTADNLPNSQALADAEAARWESLFWDHATDCVPCLEGRYCAGAGMTLIAQARNAADTAQNWSRYHEWLRGGGYERYLANDWIAA